MDVLNRAYNRFFESYSEESIKYNERVQNGTHPQFFYFMDFETQVIPAIGLYFVALAILTFIMKRRSSPVYLKPILLVYNLTCVVLAGSVCVIILLSLPDKFICIPTDITTATGELRSKGMWLFYIQKYFEFFDTIFFIMRQSWRQVTFLHIYHHASIPLVVRQFTMFDVNGDSILAAFLNSFIHVLMYSHYFFTILGKSTWWKRYLTQLQLVQFSLILTQMVVSYNIGSDCGVPDYLKLLQIVYQVTMLVLFTNFYLQSYQDGKKPAGKPVKASVDKKSS